MKQLVLGVLAHVDAGKTTLCEAMMYCAGKLKKLGRVDKGDTILDNHTLEKQRGITIFAGQAELNIGQTALTVVDTPGHVDFSAETERVLGVLDYAVLVISGIDGPQAHTRTLWRLLENHGIPTFVFITKMDLARRTKEELMGSLKRELKGDFADFSARRDKRNEELATCSEAAMECYLEKGELDDSLVIKLIKERKTFPCYFGSGLKNDGVEDFLSGIEAYTSAQNYPAEFGAKVFKISRDAQGGRLTHMKITGGALRVRDALNYRGNEEKAAQLRIYTGAKFRQVDEAPAGSIVAVLGLSKTRCGEKLGGEGKEFTQKLEPVMNYRIALPKGTDARLMYPKLKQLEEEDPALGITWNEHLQEIYVKLMGEIQAEILKSIIKDRFSVEVDIDRGRVLYKETIANTVEGVGHYEPLRHYAEVHLIMQSAPRGSGITIDNICDDELLERSWQQLIISHILEKQHMGVLTGSPLTDVRITLAAGKAHLKHTEGGDFRQATYRAVRQGLMQADCVLLEPYYAFRIELPREHIGRAESDISARFGEITSRSDDGENAVLCGKAPVTTMADYSLRLAAYTGGRGRLGLEFDGYDTCHDRDVVVETAGYQPERDLENTPDSVFCEHGGGFAVKWNDVPKYMHLESCLSTKPIKQEHRRVVVNDAEVERIMTMTYGPVKSVSYIYPKAAKSLPDTETMLTMLDPEENYLLVDGYNIIFAWQELNALAKQSVALARDALIKLLIDYHALRKCNLILVFDAYKVSGGREKIEQDGGIYIVYTKEAEIADVYIERTVSTIGKARGQVRVATSDGLEQLIILGKGALRVPARLFYEEVKAASAELEQMIKELNSKAKGTYTVSEKNAVK